MCIRCQRFGIADAQMAGPRLKRIAERQRAQRRIPTRAASVNRQSILIRQSLLDQVLCAVHTIIHVNDPPLPLEPFPIRTPITRTAAIIDIEHREAPTRPELRPQVEHTICGAGWSAVTLYKQWWQLACRRFKIGIMRRIIESIRSQSMFGWKLYRLGYRDVRGIDGNIAGTPHYLKRARCQVKLHNLPGIRWRSCREYNAFLCSMYALYQCIRHINRREFARRGIQVCQMLVTILNIATHNALCRDKSIGRLSENPFWHTKLRCFL